MINGLMPCSVASVSEGGYPRVCFLSVLKNNGIKELWFSTGASGTKIRHFKANDKASVAYFVGGDSVTLVGNMQIVSDKQVKEDFWNEYADFLSAHFNGVNDPEYVLLKFTSHEMTAYVQNAFETFEV